MALAVGISLVFGILIGAYAVWRFTKRDGAYDRGFRNGWNACELGRRL